ncbi:uncharacterized protein PGRI_056380 [Penicillium griseofulvum]|uniref:Uncharacterized protein n=1 Tax=Penicillium patulum TaxID=5078 RepID=A0A135LL86_PENPA|nr:uncharacterized protein PGRI_056380 [Penicillium griseofulvum]KXG49670.1 hypothetical protein PGRI_056380 [Penicillium griseofulvum]
MSSIFAKVSQKTKIPFSEMFEGNFTPVENYGKGGHNYTIRYQTFKYWHEIFISVIVAEMTLQGLIQRSDGIEKKLAQPVSTAEDKSKVQEWEEELQCVQREIFIQQRKLYEGEAFLPHRPLKQMYDPLREN